MLNMRTLSVILVSLLFAFSTSNAYTKVGRTKKTNSYNDNIIYTPIKFNLLIKANAGMINEDDENIPSFIDLGSKIYYGFGFGLEYHTDGKFAFGVQYDRLYKDYKVFGYKDKFLLHVYTVSGIYKFKTKVPTIPIATIQYGTANPENELASSAKTIKFGLGFISHTQGVLNLRGLFYYQRYFSSADLEKYTIVESLDGIGLEIMIGIPF